MRLGKVEMDWERRFGLGEYGGKRWRLSICKSG